MVNFGQQKLDKEIMRKKSKATTPQQRAKELNLIVRKLKNKPSPKLTHARSDISSIIFF